jgi:hypothetical protein
MKIYNSIPAVIDVEASGFGRGSYPIEVGFVLPNGESYCRLICPPKHWTHWNEESELLHGIHRDALNKYGAPVADVAKWLNEKLCGLTLYSDGWGQDVSWLGCLFEEANCAQLFRLETLPKILTEEQKMLWSCTKKRVLKQFGFQRHRASNDAIVVQRTFLETQKMVLWQFERMYR